MVTMLISGLLFSAVPAAPEPPAVIAARAAAEALVRQKAYVAAGDAYVKLAALPGVDRRDALDQAHVNYDSDYMVTRSPRSLCSALGIAELVVEEGGFADDSEAEYWRDNVRDDLDRLLTDARTTRRPNCRFDGLGAPSRPRVAMLTDEAFHGPDPRRWRRHTIAGGVFTGVGLGLSGVLIGALAVQGSNTATLRAMNERALAEGRDFTGTEVEYARRLYADGVRAQQVAIGVGIAGAITLTTGVALLATRKKTSRRFAIQPYGGLVGGGAMFRVQF